MRILVTIVVLLALATGAGGWYWYLNIKPAVNYRTSTVQRGDLLSTIGATGTLQPEEVVDVGAQVQGLIQSFGTDANGKQVDFRSPVVANQVLAKIDDAVYKADYDTALAQLDQAKANVQKGEADLAQTTAVLRQAERNWERAKKIGHSDALSESDYDMYQANYGTATANVAVAQAEIALARTQIAQAQAAVDKAKRNLDFCVIKAPVNGVIIARRVNVGQTVVASLNAPSLFLLARDLSKMQIWVSVNEADIGSIHPGQNVSFTSAGQGDHTFQGVVSMIRFDATMTQNVVTYTVVVETDNASGKLLPYMTADVQFEVQKDPNVLMVPNAALRWYPSDQQELAPGARDAWKPIDNKDQKPAAADASKPAPHGKQKSKEKERKGMIWLKDGSYVRPVPVKVGPTDGLSTEVTAEGLKEGQEIVVGEILPSEEAAERNPFLPQMKGRH